MSEFILGYDAQGPGVVHGRRHDLLIVIRSQLKGTRDGRGETVRTWYVAEVASVSRTGDVKAWRYPGDARDANMRMRKYEDASTRYRVIPKTDIDIPATLASLARLESWQRGYDTVWGLERVLRPFWTDPARRVNPADKFDAVAQLAAEHGLIVQKVTGRSSDFTAKVYAPGVNTGHVVFFVSWTGRLSTSNGTPVHVQQLPALFAAYAANPTLPFWELMHKSGLTGVNA